MPYVGHNGSRGAAEKAGQPRSAKSPADDVLSSDTSSHQHTEPKMYYICRMTEDGMWEGLRSTHDQDYAEAILDYYCERWPGAYIDILSYDEYHGGPAKWEAMLIGEAV